jgi:two-component system response regulator DctR
MGCRLCVLDDDPWVRDSLAALFRSRKMTIATFADPMEFLRFWSTSTLRSMPAALLLDVRMPAMSGIELFAQLKRHGLPRSHVVMFLTGHGDIAMAVEAMRAGAYDFLEKPFSDNSLVDRVARGMAHAEAAQSEGGACSALEDAGLTQREREIALCIVRGKTNAGIAAELCVSVRTVEVHRSNLFRKLHIRSAVELVLRLQGTLPENEAATRAL